MGEDADMKWGKTLGLILMALAVIILLLPVSAYYMEHYRVSEFKGVLGPGSQLRYYGVVGQFPSGSGKSMSLGFELNVTCLHEGEYNVSYSVYKLFGNGGVNIDRLPELPLYADSIKKVKDGWYLSKGEGLIASLIKNRIDRKILLERGHVSPSPAYGYPFVYFTIYGNDYIRYNGTYVAVSVSVPHPCTAFNSMYNIEPLCEKLSSLYAVNTSAVEKDLVAQMYFGGGNSAPDQDWRGWIKYGIGYSFPVNVALVLIGLIVMIIESREE